MSEPGLRLRGTAAYYQNYFEFAFAAVDLAAVWWQPLLKGLGRSQLEIANMHSRNALSLLRWGQAVSASRSTGDVIAANAALCQSIAGHYGDAMPKVSGALSQAAQTPVAFELLALPAHRLRDTLLVPGLADEDQQSCHQRRVA